MGDMEGKIEFSLGALTFSGSGESEWLERQLAKILEVAPELLAVTVRDKKAADPEEPNGGSPARDGQFKDTLASYIKTKNGEDNQVQRFLATADWLRQRGTTALTTALVSKALKDHHQKRLGNPSDCLNQNVAKGYCEKTGDSFFITPDGLAVLGHK